MTKRTRYICIVILIILFALCIYIQVGRANVPGYRGLMPLIFKGGLYPGVPTHTPTPKLPTPAPTITPKPTNPPSTPTPTPRYLDESTYDWAFIRYAVQNGTQTGVVVTLPGVCYDLIFDHWEDHGDGKLAVMRSVELQDGAWWCSSPPYNPSAPWPPPQYPIPTSLPPEFDYGQVRNKVFNFNAAWVCGYSGPGTTLNCYKVAKNN